LVVKLRVLAVTTYFYTRLHTILSLCYKALNEHLQIFYTSNTTEDSKTRIGPIEFLESVLTLKRKYRHNAILGNVRRNFHIKNFVKNIRYTNHNRNIHSISFSISKNRPK